MTKSRRRSIQVVAVDEILPPDDTWLSADTVILDEGESDESIPEPMPILDEEVSPDAAPERRA